MARVRKRAGHWQARWLDHNAEQSHTRQTWTKAQALSYSEEMEAKARRTPWTAPSHVPTVAESFSNSGHHGEIRRGMAADLFYNPGRATDQAISWVQDTLL